MYKRIIMVSIILVLLIQTVSALQQTAGAINLTLEPGNSVTGKYGIRNDNNVSTNINFTIAGNGSEYVSYGKSIVLSPNEFRYVNITATAPDNYIGNKSIKLIIYALEEGKKGGQIQLDVRLGKYINLDIKEKQQSIPNKSPSIPAIIFIGVILLVYVVMKKKINKICFKT